MRKWERNKAGLLPPGCVYNWPQAPHSRASVVRLALIQLQDHVWDNMTHPRVPKFRTAGSRPDTDTAAVGRGQGPEKHRPRLPAAPDAPANSDVLTHALPGATCPGHIRHVAPFFRKLPRGFPGTSRHRPLQRSRQSARGEGTF